MDLEIIALFISKCEGSGVGSSRFEQLVLSFSCVSEKFHCN